MLLSNVYISIASHSSDGASLVKRETKVGRKENILIT